MSLYLQIIEESEVVTAEYGREVIRVIEEVYKQV